MVGSFLDSLERALKSAGLKVLTDCRDGEYDVDVLVIFLPVKTGVTAGR